LRVGIICNTVGIIAGSVFPWTEGK